MSRKQPTPAPSPPPLRRDALRPIKLPTPGQGVRLYLTVKQETYNTLALLAAERKEAVNSTVRAIVETVAEQALTDYLAEKGRVPN